MPERRRQVKYETGTRHWVQQRSGGLPCLAEIIDTRANSSSGDREYYVHYCNFDKRLDEWVGEERFLTPAQTRSLGEQYFGVDPSLQGAARTLTRNLRRRFSSSFGSMLVADSNDNNNSNNSSSNHSGSTATVAGNAQGQVDPLTRQLEREHEEATKVKNINQVALGCWEINCWYFSPFPEPYSDCDKLFFCERCLKYMRLEGTLARHLADCSYSGPPGDLIYLHGGLAVFELDGGNPAHKLFCQNLCLLAKLFLDHKTIYYDVNPFLFYVLCELDDAGTHPVGFFSKEKESGENYNLACIMVLPPYQRAGYGRFLMSLSYELTRREGRTGSPEKPLSDLGLVSYQRFWAREILARLTQSSTVDLLSRTLGFTRGDIVDTLSRLGLLKMRKNASPAIHFNARLVKDLLAGQFALKPGIVELVPDALAWPVKRPGNPVASKPVPAVGTKRKARTKKK